MLNLLRKVSSVLAADHVACICSSC